MAIYQFKDFTPKTNNSNYISDSAQVIGNCSLGENANIWFNTVIRGDVNKIIIGENTNVQDLSMLHVTEVSDLIIGKNVSIGHSVTLHGCEIGDGCLIGMGAVVLDDAIIGEGSIVAGGSLVPPRKKFPKHSMIMGNPAKVVRELTPEEIHNVTNHYKSYLGYAKEFQTDCKRID
tara:strand:+ start:62357 stop:62881 length:525 start_codon:yes stop_codon:yes gene_type:complete